MTQTSRTIPAEKLSSIKSFGAADAVFEGDFKSESADAGFRLEGTLTGSIKFPCGGTVHVGPTAQILEGCIEADYVFIEGSVQGSIHARKAVEISTNATVVGAIKYDSELDIHKNAKIRGAVEFTGEMDLQAKREEGPSAMRPEITTWQFPPEAPMVRQEPSVIPHLIRDATHVQASTDQLAA